MPSTTPPNVSRPEGTSVRRASDDFVNLTAHELKNPLGVMALDAEFLARHLQDCSDTVRQTGELADVAQRMAVAARRMSEQVSDLLAIAIDDRSDSRSDVVDLNELVLDVIEDFEEHLSEVGGHLTIGELPTVDGVAAGLRMLFRNLISNGIRYRHPQRPLQLSIQAKTYPLDGGRRLLSLSVSDNGVGVSPEQQRRIFEPYSRANGDNDGLGLGLTICHRVVLRMGGTIHIESDGETGSTFSILIHDLDPMMMPAPNADEQDRRRSSDS